MHRATSEPVWARWARWCLLAVLGASVAIGVGIAVQHLFYGWDNFSGESFNVFFAHRLATGHALYRSWDDRNLLFPIYQPGFFLALAPFSRFAGLALWPSRVISIAASVIASYAAFRIARRLECSIFEALTSAFGMFAFGATIMIASAGRPDMLAVTLGVVALLAVTVWEDQPRSGLAVAAAVVTGAMIMTKLNFAPLAAGLALAIWLRRRKTGLSFTLGVAAIVVIAFAVTQITSSGAFWQNTRDFSGVGYSLAALRGVVVSAVVPVPNPILIVGAIETIFAISSGQTRAIHLNWLASMAVLASAAKLGSAGNYWLATTVASSILLGPALLRLRKASSRSVAAGVALFLSLSLCPQVFVFGADLRSEATMGLRRSVASAEAVRHIREAGGRPFINDADLALHVGVQPSFEQHPFSVLANKGRWDPRTLAKAVEDRKFSVIESSFDLRKDPIPTYQGIDVWPKVLVIAARRSYCLTWDEPLPSDIGNGFWLYEPCRD